MNLIIIFFTFFTALGIAYDRLTFDKSKISSHKKMVEWWFKIGNTIIPDYKQTVIQSFLGKLNFLTKHKIYSWKYLALTALISWVLTSMGAVFGEYMLHEDIDLPYFTLYFVNFPFDFLTIFITMRVVLLLSQKQNIIKFLSIILLHLSLTYALSVTCLVSNQLFGKAMEGQPVNSIFYPYNLHATDFYLKDSLKNDHFSDNVIITSKASSIVSLDQNVKSSFKVINNALKLKRTIDSGSMVYDITFIAKENNRSKVYKFTTYSSIPGGYIYGALSTFIPVLILLFFILLASIAKILFEISRVTAMILLDRFTESAIDKEKKKFSPEKFMPGTLTGILFGVISAFLALIKELIHFLN